MANFNQHELGLMEGDSSSQYDEPQFASQLKEVPKYGIQPYLEQNCL